MAAGLTVPEVGTFLDAVAAVAEPDKPGVPLATIAAEYQ
jgi:hypothetical protein